MEPFFHIYLEKFWFAWSSDEGMKFFQKKKLRVVETTQSFIFFLHENKKSCVCFRIEVLTVQIE